MRIRRRTVVGWSAVAAAVLAIVAVWNWTPLVPSQVGRLLTDNLLREHGYRLELDAVRGSVLGQVLFLHPRVVSIADSTQVVLRADALRVRMRHPWSILRGRVSLSQLHLERPRVDLPPPVPSAPAARRIWPSSGFPRVGIEDLKITGGRIMRRTADGTPELWLDHLDTVMRVRSRPRQVRLDLRSLRAALPADSIQVEDLAGEFTWRADSLQVEGLRLRTPNTQVQGNAALVPNLDTGRAALRAQPADLREITRLLHLPAHRGRVEGEARLAWHDASFEAEGKLDGSADDFRLEAVDFDVALSPERVQLRHVDGRVNETRLQVQLDAARRDPSLNGRATFENLDVTRLVPARWLPANAAQWPDHALNGTLHARRGAGGDSLQFDLGLIRSRVREVQIDALQARFAVRDSMLSLQSAHLESPLGKASLSGHVRGDAVEADFALDTPHLEQVLAILHQSGPQGDVVASGRLSGRLREPDVEAEAHFATMRWGDATFWEGTVGIWGRPLGADRSLDIELRSDSLRARGHTLRGLGADLVYAEPVLHVLRSQATAGDTLLAAAVSIGPRDHDWTGAPRPSTHLQVETALLRVGETEFRIEDPATIWWHGKAVHVDSLRVLTRGGGLRLGGDVDTAARTLGLRADLEGVDFEFVRQILRLRPDISGTATGWLEAHGALDRVHVGGQLAVNGGVFNGLEFDSLSVALASDDTGTELRNLQLVTPHGALHGQLRVGLLPSLARWAGDAPGGPATMDVEGAAIRGQFAFIDLELDRLWQARGTATLPPRWSAQLSSALTVSGTLGAPRLEMHGIANRIHLSPVQVDSLQFDVVYADESLVLRRLDLNTEGQVLHAEGRVPARLHWRHGFQVQKDRPIEGVATLPHSSFAIVEHFLPMFEPPPVVLPRGEVEGSIQVRGTLQAPELQGGFRVTGASFMLRDLEEVYHSVDAVGTFGGNKLVITDLRGATGTKGRIQGRGELDLSGMRLTDYSFRLDLQEVTIRSVPDITAVVSGKDVRIEGREVGSRLIPEIIGSVDVLRGEITQEFASEGGGMGPFATDVPPLYLNLTLRAERGDVWIRNSIVDAELEGNLTVQLSEYGLATEGEVRVRRGTYSYLVHRFDVTRGVLDFSRGAGFDPQLDIEGQQGRPGNREYVTLRGTATKPQLSFRSDRADRSSDEIQKDLFSLEEGRREQAGATAIADFAEQTLRDLRALPEFSIDPTLKESSSTGGKASIAQYGYNVSAGSEISNRVWLVYTQGVNSDLGQRVAIEVDINRWLLLGSSYERRDVTTTGLNQSQNAYDINLKYRHEY